MNIQPLTQGKYHDLFLGINHYILTGTHFGEGVTIPHGNELLIVIAYATREGEDADNWACLKARLEQIQAEESLPLRIVQCGQKPPFTMMEVAVAVADITRLTILLKAKPGPKGWGSPFTILQRQGLAEGSP